MLFRNDKSKGRRRGKKMDDEEQDSSPFRTCFKKNVKECESFSCVSNAMFLPWPTFVFFLPWRSAGVAR